jgi:RimJ/RimL family protein N-acetyltransferase
MILQGERVRLRPWRDADLDDFAAMNADPRVMEHFPAPLAFAESAALLARLRKAIDERGWGLWALEVAGACAGFVGLNEPSDPLPFGPCTEIGWRLRAEFWHRGYAVEAARLALVYGFDELGLREIVSYTAVGNLPSRKVMERIGLVRDLAGDFDHPRLPPGHPLCRHVLYRLAAQDRRAAD